jgi:hypothetical protein
MGIPRRFSNIMMKRLIAKSNNQILITGVYRTGSEYVAQLIGRHPEISVSMYSVNVLRFIYRKYDPISERKQYLAALDDLEQRLQARYNRSLDRHRIIDALDKADKVDYGTFYDVVMSSLYLRGPAIHWAEKNQLLWREIPDFLGMMPNGKTILVIRDPRSVLLSFKKYTYAPPPAYLGAVFNCLDAMQHGLRYGRELPSDRFLMVRYEDAAQFPQETAEKIWRFLGLNGSFDVINNMNWVDAYGHPWHANSSFHANDDPRPFDIAESVNRWQSQIGGDELALVEGVCAESMQRCGYELSCEGVHDWLSVLRLFIHDDHVTGYFRHWLETGGGIQAFPTDPLAPANWRNE